MSNTSQILPLKKSSKPKPSPITTQAKNRFLSKIDPSHIELDSKPQDLVKEIWESKYRYDNEASVAETFQRVAGAIYANDTPEYMQECYEAMFAGLWMPGGRIIAGAGTSKRVTLMNCYVNKQLEDSLDDIMRGISIAALTQQQGGGIGTDFSPLRPQGAILHRTGARASGPLPFMDMWHAMCSTIMSAGDRRGAMMGTICDTHPDLPQFITAKQTPNRLTNFNVSVLVSDALMGAVADDEDWTLYFHVQPKELRSQELVDLDFFDEDTGQQQYVYSVWRARDLWTLITKNTYDWSEPGIIFIDRINELNNLKYCETISCTNPCGEQPLPPNGTCNLGAINLARMVTNPFRPNAQLNLPLIEEITRIGTRFLDNVIDITQYPMDEQAAEERRKRRLGLGVSGLADCLAQLSLRYGSAQATATTEKIFQTICIAAYESSIDLAKERGPFDLFENQKFLSNTFASNLPDDLQERIRHDGIRNGVLLTVAPTGTTSILYGNISSGIEPVFAHKSDRRVRQGDNTFKTYTSYGYNLQLYSLISNKPIGSFDMPPTAVEVADLRIEDHIVTQAAVQRWVDASVSKTVNISETTPYEQFKSVYDLAYSLGCKGCTTYRPSEVRGSILSRADSQSIAAPKLAERLEVLSGTTHKVKWPSMSSALYVTVNRGPEGQPFEIFFNSKDARSQEWTTALSLMISAILRKGDGDISFISQELGAVHSTHDTAWIKIPNQEKPKFFGSIIAYIGYILGQDFGVIPSEAPTQAQTHGSSEERCPSCFAPALEYKEGCKSCTNCGYSDCQ
jgi:ribonucleoside-diphosphate reductase alpha chain